jgi:hypothetical protein
MTKFLSNFLFGLSVITHPVFLPLYVIIWYLFYPSLEEPLVYAYFLEIDLKLKWLFFYSLFSVVIPLLIFIVSRILRLIKSIFLKSTDERRYFFLIMGVYYWFVFYLFNKTFHHHFFKAPILLIGECAMIMFISSLFTTDNFKLSIHTAGLGAVTGFYAGLIFIYKTNFLNYVVLLVVISSIIMAVRMLVRAHNFLEVLSGWTLGFYSCALIILAGYTNFFDL